MANWAEDRPLNLTTAEVAARLRISVRTLENWRQVKGRGPRFAKFGKRVLYPVAEVEAYERGQLRQSSKDG